MTRMCPIFIEDGAPPGEKRIFRRLAEIEGDWVSIHSLDVAPSNHNKRTEIDFLVIIPDVGLLCIEVKSHENISFDGRQWSPQTIVRSPFKQAQDAKHALVRRFKKIRQIPEGGRLPFPIGQVCIFTASPFDATGRIGINPSELIDSRQLESLATWHELRDKLKRCLLSSLRNEHIHPLSTPLTAVEIDQILKECIPIQTRKAQSAEELAAADRDLRSMLREQQRPVLRLAELNHRLFVTGPAGTGKTLIAVEMAKRIAEGGKRVGLFCFNKLLGEWLGIQLHAHPNIVVGTAYGTLSRMTGVPINGSMASEPHYWNTDLPEAFQERMTSPDFAEDYSVDVLIIDEAQDLIPRSMLWECLMLLLHGGERNGTWLVFGDFSNQSITESHGLAERVEFLMSSARPAHWELRENCRNLSLIGRTAEYLLGIETSIYEGYMRAGEDPEFRKYLSYSSTEEQEQLINQEIAALTAQGFKPDEMILLSFCAEENCIARRMERSGQNFSPVARSRPGCVCYASINAFKGMERQVVIITDVDRLYELRHERPRLFVGATRATDRLRIALSDEVADSL